MLGSSVDSQKVSLTVKGLVSLLVAAALMLGIDVDQTHLETTLFSIATGASAIVTLIGLIRKIVVKIKNRP